MNRDNKENRV